MELLALAVRCARIPAEAVAVPTAHLSQSCEVLVGLPRMPGLKIARRDKVVKIEGGAWGPCARPPPRSMPAAAKVSQSKAGNGNPVQYLEHSEVFSGRKPGDGAFGVISSTASNATPRQFQFALKVLF
jgi:hypothetical protein